MDTKHVTYKDGKIISETPVTLPDEFSNTVSMNEGLGQALDSLRAYRDAASPNQAQTVAVVKVLCRVAIRLIRLRLGKLEATE